MTTRKTIARFFLSLTSCLLWAAACFSEGPSHEQPATGGTQNGGSGGVGGADGSVETEPCTAVRSAEKLPARSAVMSSEVASGPPFMAFDSLYQTFSNRCGGCHITPSSRSGFNGQKVTQD